MHRFAFRETNAGSFGHIDCTLANTRAAHTRLTWFRTHFASRNCSVVWVERQISSSLLGFWPNYFVLELFQVASRLRYILRASQRRWALCVRTFSRITFFSSAFLPHHGHTRVYFMSRVRVCTTTLPRIFRWECEKVCECVGYVTRPDTSSAHSDVMNISKLCAHISQCIVPRALHKVAAPSF